MIILLVITESEQKTGSFKLRGAFNKLLSLKELNDEALLTKATITASTGNHGAATVSESCLILGRNLCHDPDRVITEETRS